MTRTIDLRNLNIASGQCVNDTVPQNVTFSEQGGVLGGNSNGGVRYGYWSKMELIGWMVIIVTSLTLGIVGL